MTGEQRERDDGPERPSDESSPSHPDLDTLAAWAGGVPSPDAAADRSLAAHVAACPTCTGQVEDLAAVSSLLAAQPSPPMPADVFARLDDVIAMESASRIAVGSGHRRRDRAPHPPVTTPSGRDTEDDTDNDTRTGAPLRPALAGPVHGDPYPRPHLGRFADQPGARPHRRGRLGRVLGGLVLAGVLACVGYVLSASVGLNEPTAVNPVSVDPSSLQSEAVTAEHGDLSPHRFSRAWRCARAVTDGSITGIRPVVVDGVPSYLVFTSDDGVSAATVVTGCTDGRPRAGASVRIPGR